MWSGESAWRRRREGVEHTEANELAGPAYYAVGVTPCDQTITQGGFS
jgi:hypothetical protein